MSANKPCLFTYPYVASAKWSPHLLHLCLFCSVSIKDRAVLCQARRHCPFLCLLFGASQVSVAEVASGQAFKARSLPLRQCLNVMHTSKVCLLPGSGPTFSCALSMQALMRHICWTPRWGAQFVSVPDHSLSVFVSWRFLSYQSAHATAQQTQVHPTRHLSPQQGIKSTSCLTLHLPVHKVVCLRPSPLPKLLPYRQGCLVDPVSIPAAAWN